MIEIPTPAFIGPYKININYTTDDTLHSQYDPANNTILLAPDKDAREVLDSFLHEVAEVSCVYSGTRYTSSIDPESDIAFVMNHKQFRLLIHDLTRAVCALLEVNGLKMGEENGDDQTTQEQT